MMTEEGASLVIIGVAGGLGALHVYDASSDGAATELRSFRSSTRPFSGMSAVEIVGDEIYICDGNNIQVFDLDTDGIAPAKRLIEGPDSEVSCASMVIHGGEIYESGVGGKLVVHELEATGNSPPLREIRGPRSYVKVQISGGHIFASSDDRIDVFPINASGDVTPTRSIRLAEIDAIAGFLATDTELFVANIDDTKLRVYDAAATDAAFPIRVLKGLPLDSRTPAIVGNELFIPHQGPLVNGTQTMGSYSVFEINASDFDEPLRRVSLTGDSFGTVNSLDAR